MSPNPMQDMAWFEKLFWYFQAGGLLMYPLAVLSIVALAVIVERAIRLKRDRLLDSSLLETVQTNLEKGAFKTALAKCTGSTVLLGQVLEGAFKEFIHTSADIEIALQETGQRELQVLRNNLAVLGTVARVAPLMGLLGTVIGMIGAFEVLSVEGVGKEDMAAQIRVALITTATGLIIAIPTVIANAFYKSKIRRIIANFEDIFIDVIKSAKIGLKVNPDMDSKAEESEADSASEDSVDKPDADSEEKEQSSQDDEPSDKSDKE